MPSSGDPDPSLRRHLISVAEIGESGVAVLPKTKHGSLAVGLVDGEPFAVSNRCRHMFAQLGQGRVADGCLECPRHGAHFDVRNGKMARGPQGKIPAIGNIIKSFLQRRRLGRLNVYPVEIRDGEIWLRY
jgi:3-phenylpropionate/trans-cinnamate dioxygenase ferredoxin component